MARELNLTEGEILPNLLKFTFPILLTILLQTAYGTADLYIVGKFSPVGDISAVTIGSQIMQAVIYFSTGISTGTTVLIGKYIGSNEKEKANTVINVSIFLFTFVALIIMFFLITFNKNIAIIMKTPTEAMEQTRNYLTICGFGTVFIVFYNLIGSIFRGIGDSKTPLTTVFVACIINIILDFILIGIFDLGAKGASIATIIAQGSSVAISILIIKNKIKNNTIPFSISVKDIKFNKVYIVNIIKLGLPVALQGTLVTMSFLFITAIVNNFGVSASASVGIVEKITSIIMVVPSAFTQSLSVYTAQNIGAGKIDRTKKGLLYGISISLVFGSITAYLATFHGTIFTTMFTKDYEITFYALLYLKSYAVDCILVAILFSFSGYFNGCGKTKFVMIQGVLGAFLIRIPLAYIISQYETATLFHIGMATPTSTFFQIIACVIYFKWISKNEEIGLSL